MFGDYLNEHFDELSKSSTNKNSVDAFWKVLQRIAVQDILNIYPEEVDSPNAIVIYYSILKENEAKIPVYFRKILKSNGQERYRVINRNMFVTNAYHPDGLANQRELVAKRDLNFDRRGSRIIYKGKPEYANK